MSWFLTRLVEQLLFPPFILLALAGLGLLLAARGKRLGLPLAALSLALLYAAATPLLGRSLVQSLETVPALAMPLPSAQAVVILGSGVYPEAPEYGGDSLAGGALERLRYGAYLHRLTGKPVLVAGGAPAGSSRPEAELMKEVLEREFAVPVAWAESASANTRENAEFAWRILEPQGITRVYLVSHALHMARAAEAFRRAGFEVVPAPTMFSREGRFTVLDLLPQGRGLMLTTVALHEWLGRLWYAASR